MKLLSRRGYISALTLMLAMNTQATEPVFHQTFDSESDLTGTYTGQLCNGATLKKEGEEGILDLGSGGGYFDFGKSLGTLISKLSGDYSVSLNLFIPESTSISSNGNFIFNFGNSSSTGYAFFGAKESRYSITETNWNGEQTVSAAQAFPKGEWVNVIIVQSGNTASVYFNGELKKTSTITLHPSKLGNTSQNWLGRSPYDGDVMLIGAKYSDFRIYDSALTAEDIKVLSEDPVLALLNADVYEQQVDETMEARNFDFIGLRRNVSLPTNLGNGVTAVWESDAPEYVTSTGKVTRPAVGKEDASLTLTAVVTKGDCTKRYDYPATVVAQLSDESATEYDLTTISLKGSLDNLRSDLSLPTSSVEGSLISWRSDKESYLTSTGKLVKLSDGEEKEEVTLTAKAERNGVESTKEFKVRIAYPENYDSYLFVYFPSNSDENLYYALSTDGFKYTPLNNGKCVMSSDTVALKKGIRDPHILRGEDGKTFYMVATDMKCSEGWASNRGIVMYKSTDLVHWTHSTVHFPTKFPEWANVTRVWAPEVIWDPNYVNTDGSKGRYMVYYSLLTSDGKCSYDKIYYSYANDDFTDLITDPVYFYDRGSATIDGDIIYDEVEGLYHMFFKNESLGGICQVTATSITPEEGKEPGSQWSSPSNTLQMTTEAVEGAGVFRMISSDTWVLMYDCYNNGHYQFCTTNDFENFTLKAQTETSGAFTPRHGTVMPLTPEETSRLIEAFPPETQTLAITGSSNANVRSDNLKVAASAGTIYLPVRPGTDMSSFDPQFTATFGATVTPEGAQDFTQGELTYTVTDGTQSKSYKVTTAVEANPVLPGFTADPEMLYSKKTGRFYIYPTSDGYPSWGGYKFNVYSSADLVNWTLENCILDLSSDDVLWATGNAWAPCIEEKYEDGEYKYYFYFSGQNPDYGYKTLGCAVSDSPTGPFHDLGYPLVSTNVTSGQLIDSDVFTDPVSGNTYYYWGNGNLVASRLDSDMVTINDATVITPSGGTTSDYAFREGVYVFYRNGIYYFLWSVDDTGAKNYHVAYGTSDSPMGPITVASSPIVLQQSAKNYIYGTGHNSVVQIPGRDEWYIVYHRINRNFVSNNPGYHREVCIDKMEFNEDGTIAKVTPTHTGISPVTLSESTGVSEIESSVEKNANVLSTEYYSISGFKLSGMPTLPGLYIKSERLSNGTIRAEKVRM